VKLILFFFVLSFSSGFDACKQSSQVNSDGSQKKKDEVISSPGNDSVKAAANNYRLTISFNSIGAGIDYKTKEKYDAFIKEYEKQNKVNISFEITPWGKEGEIDYCFLLKELAPDMQLDFIKRSKEISGASKTIGVEENSPCRYKK